MSRSIFSLIFSYSQSPMSTLLPWATIRHIFILSAQGACCCGALIENYLISESMYRFDLVERHTRKTQAHWTLEPDKLTVIIIVSVAIRLTVLTSTKWHRQLARRLLVSAIIASLVEMTTISKAAKQSKCTHLWSGSAVECLCKSWWSNHHQLDCRLCESGRSIFRQINWSIMIWQWVLIVSIDMQTI